MLNVQVVESTGFVMVPYQQYPNLMGALLSMLADRNNETLRYPVVIVSSCCKPPWEWNLSFANDSQKILPEGSILVEKLFFAAS